MYGCDTRHEDKDETIEDEPVEETVVSETEEVVDEAPVEETEEFVIPSVLPVREPELA